MLVEALLVTFIWRYRRQRRERFEDGAQIHGATSIELMWTVAPVIVLFLIGGFVFFKLPGIADVPPAAQWRRAARGRVTGRQYYWQYEYPNGVVAIDKLRAPAGVPVRLEVTAPDEDVIHSWWIPALGGKIDAIPGVTNETWFEAERPASTTASARSSAASSTRTCSPRSRSCPQPSSPPGSRTQARERASVELGEEAVAGRVRQVPRSRRRRRDAPQIAGSPVLADREALEEIVRNGRGAMPAVGSGWSEEQVDALIAYLRESPPSGS